MNHRIPLVLTVALLLNLILVHTAAADTTEPITIEFPRRQNTPVASSTTTSSYVLNRAQRSLPKSNTDFICYVIDSISTEMLSRKTLAVTGAGVLADKAIKASPSGKKMVAPDFTVLEVKSKRKVSLSQFKGQVVLIDFWASWCGPCQRPMAVNQEIMRKHPEWKDKAVILTVSMDDELETVRDHLDENRWNATLNTWSPPDAQQSGSQVSAPRAYAVKSIPTMVLIDADGMVVKYGDVGDIETAMLALIK